MAIEANQKKELEQAVIHDTNSATSQVIFALEGMTCASCAMRIEKGLKKVPGVIDAQVNLATERGTVTYNPAQTGLTQLVQKVEAVGYKASPLDQQQPQTISIETAGNDAASLLLAAALQEDERGKRKTAEIVHKRNLLLLGIVLSLPIVVLS